MTDTLETPTPAAVPELGSDPRFNAVVEALDSEHRQDPRKETWNGEQAPRAVIYHARMAYWVERVTPSPSDVLRLAVRAQHVRRWASPRSDYPEGRAGYKAWRRDLAKLHATVCGEAMRAAGYGDDDVERAGQILRKMRLKKDPEVQALEDSACLTFLELDLLSFMAKHERSKVIDIVQKTWAKMSGAGHGLALDLLSDLPEPAQELLKEALA